MSFSAPFGARAVASGKAAAVDERRTFKRVNLVFLGRFMRANKAEYPCRMQDISPGDASIYSPIEMEIGERVVAQFDQIGTLEGHVARLFDGGFAMAFSMTEHKREKLAATLMHIINKADMPGIEGRRHERLVPANNTQVLKLAEDISVECRVLDVSLSGASLKTVARPPLGTEVKLGNLRCCVVRHHEEGIALQFVDVQNPNALRRYFG